MLSCQCVKNHDQPFFVCPSSQCYACINSCSGLLQFAILPIMIKRLDTRQLWLIMPSLMVTCASLMTLQQTASIHLIAASFLLMKAGEYSVRGVTTEMVYVSLDYESRFLGKEIIGVFVNRVGKSAVAIGLSAVAAYFGTQFDLHYLSIALAVGATAWLIVSWRLAGMLSETDTDNEVKSKTE